MRVRSPRVRAYERACARVMRKARCNAALDSSASRFVLYRVECTDLAFTRSYADNHARRSVPIGLHAYGIATHRTTTQRNWRLPLASTYGFLLWRCRPLGFGGCLPGLGRMAVDEPAATCPIRAPCRVAPVMARCTAQANMNLGSSM